MFYTVYKITNIINDKIYIGVHKTTDINDSYMGSGKHLIYAQEKYGIENFKKEIIEVFDNAEDMFNMESQLVNEEFVSRNDTYNLKQGGYGGWDHLIDFYIGSYKHREQYLRNLRKSIDNGNNNKRKNWLLKNDKEWFYNYSVSLSNGLKNFYENGGTNGFKNMKHSEETKKRIGEANSIHQQGDGNSRFGTMWIHNIELQISKSIKKEEFPEYETQGWLKGRKMKFQMSV